MALDIDKIPVPNATFNKWTVVSVFLFIQKIGVVEKKWLFSIVKLSSLNEWMNLIVLTTMGARLHDGRMVHNGHSPETSLWDYLDFVLSFLFCNTSNIMKKNLHVYAIPKYSSCGKQFLRFFGCLTFPFWRKHIDIFFRSGNISVYYLINCILISWK